MQINSFRFIEFRYVDLFTISAVLFVVYCIVTSAVSDAVNGRGRRVVPVPTSTLSPEVC